MRPCSAAPAHLSARAPPTGARRLRACTRARARRLASAPRGCVTSFSVPCLLAPAVSDARPAACSSAAQKKRAALPVAAWALRPLPALPVQQAAHGSRGAAACARRCAVRAAAGAAWQHQSERAAGRETGARVWRAGARQARDGGAPGYLSRGGRLGCTARREFSVSLTPLPPSGVTRPPAPSGRPPQPRKQFDDACTRMPACVSARVCTRPALGPRRNVPDAAAGALLQLCPAFGPIRGSRHVHTGEMESLWVTCVQARVW